MALVTTPGAANANSYCSAAEADAYFETRLHDSVWDTLDDPEAALIWATRLLDERFVWAGTINSSSQALRWPRIGVYNDDGVEMDSATIPQWLKNATAELALKLAASDRTDDASSSGLRDMKVGPIELTFDKHYNIPTIPPSVIAMVASYGYLKTRRRKLVRTR